MVPLRPDTEPAPTIGSSGLSTGRDVWVFERPSTAVCGDPRISPPGYRGNPEDYRDGNPTRSGDNAIRVSIEEASILQGFPVDYPWQGSRSKRFEQVGNAVPPPLARAVVASLVSEAIKEKAA